MPRPEADVLLAEDEPVVCRAVERILGSTGLTAEVTGTLVETLDRLRTTAFQILICDLMLPDGSGFEALAAARNRQPDLQTIVITGFATANNAVRSLARGAFDYLQKPEWWTGLSTTGAGSSRPPALHQGSRPSSVAPDRSCSGSAVTHGLVWRPMARRP